MALPLSHQVADHVETARQLYHRLVIVVGPPQSGKTRTLLNLQDERGWPLLNINLLLSEKLLELTAKQRALRVARFVHDIVHEQPGEIVLLDNIEMLFHPDLKQDPLRLLQTLSRNRTIVTTWRGALLGTSLTYAKPDHPEFRRFEKPQAIIVFSGGPSGRGEATPSQEQSA